MSINPIQKILMSLVEMSEKKVYFCLENIYVNLNPHPNTQFFNFGLFIESKPLASIQYHDYGNLPEIKTEVIVYNQTKGLMVDWHLNDFNLKEESKKDDIELILTHGKVFHHDIETLEFLEIISEILDIDYQTLSNEDILTLLNPSIQKIKGMVK